MESIYKREIIIPENIDIEVKDKWVKVKGPYAELERNFIGSRRVNIKKDGNKIIITSIDKKKKSKALVGTIWSHIQNMIKGSQGDFKVIQKIVYAHFPINVRVEGDLVYIENFLGERAPRIAKIVGDRTKVEVKGDDIIISGPNIEHVTQTAANITLATKIKNKDPRIFQDGIFKYKKLYKDTIIWELKF